MNTEQLRAEFEAWTRYSEEALSRDARDGYCIKGVDNEWRAYQAGRAAGAVQVEPVTGDLISELLASIQFFGSRKREEGAGLSDPTLQGVRAAWDDVYRLVQALAAAPAGQGEPDVAEPSPAVITSAADLIEGEYYWVQEVNGTGYMEACVVRGDALWHTGSSKRLPLDIFNGRYIAEPIAAPKFAGVAHG